MIAVDQYAAADGRDVFAEWLDSLADRRASAAVAMRIGRLRRGLLGDWRVCRAGIMELRIDVGTGYRVYFAGNPQVGYCWFAAAPSAARPAISTGRWSSYGTIRGAPDDQA